MCPYVHFLMRCYVNRFNAVCEVNCLYDFMGQGTLCFADVKLNANMLLHGSILLYVCLRVPSLKIKIVPLTFNVSYTADYRYMSCFSTEIFPYLSKELTEI